MKSSRPRTWREAATGQFSIFWVALPLSGVMLLGSLCANMPRYFIEHHMGARELGIFSAAASLVSVGNTVINAVGQTVTPRLAKLFAWEGADVFASYSFRLLGFGAGLGLCAVACAVTLGRWTLALMFRPEYAGYAWLLTALMAAGAIGYMASLLGYAVTAARSFRAQMPLFVVVTAVTLLASALLIPAYGLAGAAMASGISSTVQLVGLAFLFLRLTARSRSLTFPALEAETSA